MRISLPAGQGGERLYATCLMARETSPPGGDKGLCWCLLTNREAGSVDDLSQWIEWYRARWEIEMYFHVLKNGCRVEALQLGSRGKVELALAIYMVVSWRIARLMRLSRTQPDMKADQLFSREEWQAAYLMKRKVLPKETPSLREVVRLVAMVGGFMGRKNDGEPGAQTLWQGLERVRTFVEHFDYARGVIGSIKSTGQ
ncbi:IS4 family transposase [Paludibacterium paludis]|uniref:IS4 family transposase n=1 Tax=Paludibacterium paludis TaxID=1225769 RepID=UPI0016753269|nr:IS4 family transposase [Paludibacterium paludis]